jgi:hypothetical protein
MIGFAGSAASEPEKSMHEPWGNMRYLRRRTETFPMIIALHRVGSPLEAGGNGSSVAAVQLRSQRNAA